MTLFIRTPKRLFEISDAYVMALVFVIFFAVVRIFGLVVQKLIQKNAEKQKKNISSDHKTSKTIRLPDVRGGGISIETDDTELAYTILSCIADNENYLIKNPALIELVFKLVKAKITKESLVLTPNMMRFLALKLIKQYQTMIFRVGNTVMASENVVRFKVRIAGSVILRSAAGIFYFFVTSMSVLIPYVVLMWLLFFDVTASCGFTCSNYFEHLPKGSEPVVVYSDRPTGQVVINGNDKAHQVEMYNPVTGSEEVKINNSKERSKTVLYQKSRIKPKLVRFSEFAKTDPVLSKFKDQGLQEPEIPQKFCPIKENPLDILDLE